MSVLLIALVKNKKVFLYNREKRPFSGKLSLPGGRLIMGESIPQGVSRIMKKFNINAKLKKINSISLEHVKRKDKKIHSFVLILVTASTEDDLKYFDFEKNKKKVISSDYNLLKSDLNNEVKIKNFFTLA